MWYNPNLWRLASKVIHGIAKKTQEKPSLTQACLGPQRIFQRSSNKLHGSPADNNCSSWLRAASKLIELIQVALGSGRELLVQSSLSPWPTAPAFLRVLGSLEDHMELSSLKLPLPKVSIALIPSFQTFHFRRAESSQDLRRNLSKPMSGKNIEAHLKKAPIPPQIPARRAQLVATPHFHFGP